MSWLAALLATTAMLLVLHPVRLPTAPAPPEAPSGRQPAALHRWRPLLAAGAAGGGWALLGGPVGLVGGGVLAAVVWHLLGRSEDPALARRRVELAEDLPLGVDLLASCLDAGAAPEAALVKVAAAVEGPVGEEFLALHHRLAVGVDPVEAWGTLARHPQLGPLGRAVRRAHETGASVGPAVHRLAEELADRARADVEERARSIEVRAAAPLGLCLLPAFMVLGVVPMVVAVFSSMQPFR